jgi:hypothetical protein
MVHKPIAIMILPVFVAGILMLGILATTGNAQESSNTGTAAQEASNNRNTATAILKNTATANTILKIHNDERDAVGVPALKWSDSLAADAKSWAEHLASLPPKPSSSSGWNQCCGGQPDLVHSSTEHGENLWAGSAGGYSTADSVQGWANEKNHWKYSPIGDPSGCPSGKMCGHYTQMVWRTTTDVGCATAIGNHGKFEFLVCQYRPPGNYNGQKPY